MPSSMLPPTNPFAKLRAEVAAKVLSDYRIKAQAQRRLQRLLETYAEVAQDPRYKALRDELRLSLGDYLRDLVDRAQACPRCAPTAAPIVVLQRAIAEPLEEVWFANEHAEMPAGQDPLEPEDET